MEKIGKIKTIYRAFTTDSGIESRILQYRKDICDACEYNSKNMDKEDLDFFSKLRKKAIGDKIPFCSICKCQIAEKILQETEECGLGEKGFLPKWNRIKIETINKEDLNFINNSQEKVNIDLSPEGNCFEVRFGEIDNTSNVQIECLLESKQGNTLDITQVKPGCKTCTSYEYYRVDPSCYSIKFTLNTNKLSGSFKKRILIGYNLNKSDITKGFTIVLIGSFKKPK